MPVPLRANHHRADAKYNVTTDFPSFGLHSAASTGDVGLVEYALSRGQPVNSVVDGVLPLHAACAGGNVRVVKLLIDYGAEVNAPRLPKRYSSRDSSAPIIGTTGSTPLHFAAANGNKDAIELLLRHGAHADRADKHGVTPEALARENGWIECADLLKEWIINKDRDLRERDELVPSSSNEKDDGRRRHRLGSVGESESSTTTGPQTTHRRRLQVKHSIEGALSMLRSSSSNLTEVYHRTGHTPTPPTSPTRPFGDFTSELGTNGPFPDPSTRRPSLPPADSFPRARKPSARSEYVHRPRSAGEGADQATTTTAVPTPPQGSSGSRSATRKVGSKVSLLNLFRRGQNSENASSSPEPTTTTTAHSYASDQPLLSTSPPKPTASISGSFLPHHRSRLHQDSDASIRSRAAADASLEQKPPLNSPSHSTVPLAVDLHNSLAQGQQQLNNRDRSRSNASSRYEYNSNDDPILSGQGSYHNTTSSSPLARLNLFRNQSHHRTRSGSGSSLTSRLGMTSTTATSEDVIRTDNDKAGGGSGADTDNTTNNISTSLPRPGILKPHSRSGSGGQSHAHSALRTLSRDAASHSPSPRSTPARLKPSTSVGSLGRSNSYTKQQQHSRRRPGSAGSASGSRQGDGNEEERAVIEERVEEGDYDEEEEEEYGKPIEVTTTPSLLIGVGGKSPSRTSLSPITSNDPATSGGDNDALMADFPFSINRPPPMPVDGELPDEKDAHVTAGAAQSDSRGRGDSLSSGGTVDSQQTGSSTASTRMVATPLMSSEAVSPSNKKEEVLMSGVVDAGYEDRAHHHPHYIVVSPAVDIPLPTPPPSSTPPPPPPPSHHYQQTRPGPLPLQTTSPDAHSHSHEKSSSSSLFPPSTAYSSGYSSTGSMSGRRLHTPFDIDISSISSHAQAEALVEKARREVMELVSMEERDFSETGSDGRTPLSARLAAYGESLALEKKFREMERGGGGGGLSAGATTISTIPTSGEGSAGGTDPGSAAANLALPVANQHSADGSGYAASLYSGKSVGMRDVSPRSVSASATAGKHVKRPSTAEGLALRDANLSLSSEQSDQSYQSSRSASAIGHRRGADFSSYNPIPIPTLNVPSSSDEDSGTYHKPSPSLNYIMGSRTPTGDYRGGIKPRRMGSLDGVEYTGGLGPELERVSTAPSPARPPYVQAQAQVRSAKKLAKMGISVANQRDPMAPSSVRSGKGFGAIKSLFKGKS